MQVTRKKLPASQIEISVTLPWEEWRKDLDHALKDLGKEVKIPGFRAGNIPREVLEKRLGKAALLQEAATLAIRRTYPQALKQEKIEAIGEPAVTLENLIENEAFTYRIVTAVMPEVALGSFTKAVKKINENFKKGTDAVEEKDIDEELGRLAAMRAPTVLVRRPARTGDEVQVDFAVGRDGVPIEKGTAENHALVLGSNAFIPGFEEKVIGMAEGEKKKFLLKFPDAYHAKELAGKPAEFEVTLKSVKERQIPPIDDAFAKSLGNFESLAKVKESLHRGMLDEKKAKRQNDRRAKILDALVEASSIDLPAVLVREETERMFRELAGRAESMGVSAEAMLTQADRTREQLATEWEPQAKKRISANLILNFLADREALVAESAEIEKEMNKTVGMFQSEATAKKIDMARLYEAVRERLRNEKAFQWLESL